MNNLIIQENMSDQEEDTILQSSNSENNKRIAKNTLFLYFRSILTLGIGLYTSREVLAQLGVSDFGIYNVLGGVIVLFSFIQNAMSNATSRFFTFDLGKGDFEALKKTFNLSMVIHIFTALLILILGETIGFWFLNTRLVIPEDRMGAANFVYQFSVLSACLGILQVPYIVAINAHERMKIFAYFGIADAVFKLAIVFALGFSPFDKLKFYSVLLFAVYIIMIIFYQIYCRRNFKETHFKWFWDKKMFLERIDFGGWTMLQGTSVIAALQGVNMIVNMFHGVIANAAYGIMTQVTNAMTQFANNFFAAVNPQITKSYARGDMDYLHSLLFRSIKFSFLISFALAVPLVINMDFILHLWLKTVPEYAVVFCQIRVVDWCLCMFFIPISLTITATGKIKRFLIIDSILTIQNFIFVYILFKLNFSPTIVPIVYLMVNIVRIINIFFLAKSIINFKFLLFAKNILLRLLVLFIICLPLPIFINFHLENIRNLLVTSLCFLMIFIPSTYYLVLEKEEKIFVVKNILSKISSVRGV
jgi:O-antigen/teichoic acid export membrane protein